MTTTMSTIDAKENLTDLLNQVAQTKERIILVRRGKEIAALVPIEDLHLLETSQSKGDLEDAMDAYKEAKNTGTTSLEQLKNDIGA